MYYKEENIGFEAAQNQAIRLSNGEWVLTLNPDVLLLPNFIQSLIDAAQLHPRIGTVCVKLLTMTAHFEIPEKPVVDSTGIYFNPMLRHLDRGSQEVDNGHYLQYEYVFGATAAAALYRRAMIDDIAVDGEFFDSDFFVGVALRQNRFKAAFDETPAIVRNYSDRDELAMRHEQEPGNINFSCIRNRTCGGPYRTVLLCQPNTKARPASRAIFTPAARGRKLRRNADSAIPRNTDPVTAATHTVRKDNGGKCLAEYLRKLQYK